MPLIKNALTPVSLLPFWRDPVCIFDDYAGDCYEYNYAVPVYHSEQYTLLFEIGIPGAGSFLLYPCPPKSCVPSGPAYAVVVYNNGWAWINMLLPNTIPAGTCFSICGFSPSLGHFRSGRMRMLGSTCDTAYVTWGGYNETLGYDYGAVQNIIGGLLCPPRQFFRFPIQFINESLIEEGTIAFDSTGRRRQLNSRVSKQYQISTDWIPDFGMEQLALAAKHDLFEVLQPDWATARNLIIDGIMGYEDQPNYYFRFRRGTGTFLDQDYSKLKSFCGAPCPPP